MSGTISPEGRGVRIKVRHSFRRALLQAAGRPNRKKWFDTARTDSSWKVTAAYDPRDAGLIYISPVAGGEPVECHLLDKDRGFEGMGTGEAKPASPPLTMRNRCLTRRPKISTGYSWRNSLRKQRQMPWQNARMMPAGAKLPGYPK